MKDSKKRTEEKIIFDLVYNNRKDLTIDHEDKPDFWIGNNLHQKFGVEITQLFKNESDARLKYITNYLGDLLDSKKFKHKEDIQNLKVDEIKFIDRSGKETKTQAVIQNIPVRNEYLNILLNRISEKSSLIANYNKNLSYYNLIIFDNSNSLTILKKDDFFNFVFELNIIEALLNSDYQEIFLITNISKSQYFFPLKRILFLSRIFLFQEILNKIIPSNKDLPDEKYFNWFGEFLIMQGFKNVKLRSLNEEIELKYNSTGFMFNDGNIIALRDYDLYLTDNSIFKDIIETRFITPEIRIIINDNLKWFGFSCGLGTETKKSDKT
jgi:hypothetical protein